MTTNTRLQYVDHPKEREAMRLAGHFRNQPHMLAQGKIEYLREVIVRGEHIARSEAELRRAGEAARNVPFGSTAATAPRTRTASAVVQRPAPRPATHAKAATPRARSTSAITNMINRSFEQAQTRARMEHSCDATGVIETDYKLSLGVDPSSEAMRQHTLSLLRSGASAMHPSDTKAARALAVRMGLQHEGAGSASTSTRLVLE